MVYAVRRHRTDDYQGRYRVWLWAAGCWLLLATDQAASLREAFRSVMIDMTGTPLLGDGSLWWVIVYVLIFGAVGSRLLLDMRPSRLSIAALLTAAVAEIVTMAGRLGWIALGDGVQDVMFLTGSEMAGNLMLLAAMALHARYVLLDAEGLLPIRQPAADAAETAEEAADEDEEAQPPVNAKGWTKIDPPHAMPQPVHQRATAPAAASPAATSSAFARSASGPQIAVGGVAPANHKLTKAERKALKERLLHERLERERRF
jgi:hypothetical protein